MKKSKTDALFNGMSVQTITLIITAVVEMVMFSFWSRHLSKQDFGYMAAISGILAIVECISTAGLGSAIVQKKDASKEFISTAFTLSLILGLVGMFVVLVFAPQLAILVAGNEYLTKPLRVMSVNVLLLTLLSVSGNQLTKQLRFKRKAVISISSIICSSLLGVILALKGFGLYALIVVSIATPLFSLILMYLTSLKIPRICIHKKYISGIVSFGGWLTAGSIINSFSHKADALMLSRLLSVEALGAYHRPAGFVNNISTKVNGVFDSVLFPLLSSIQDDAKKVHDVLLRSISLLNSFSIVLAAIFFFNAELIITVFFGAQWLELVPIMRIVSISVIFKINGRLVDCFFRSLNLVRLGAILRFVQGGIVILAIIFGAQFGIIGVAVAMTISDIIVILMKVFSLVFSVKMSSWEVVKCWLVSWRSIIPILAISIPYLFVSHSLIVNIVYAVCFALVSLCEFVLWPKIVGKEYANTVGPQIEKLMRKMIFCNKTQKNPK